MQGTEQGETDNMEIIFNDWKICHQEKTFNEFNWTKKNSIVLYFSSGEMLGLYFEFTKQISESIIKHKLPCPPTRRVNADEFVRNGRSYGPAMFEIYSNASGRRKEDEEGNVGFCIWKLILPFKFPFPFHCKYVNGVLIFFPILQLLPGRNTTCIITHMQFSSPFFFNYLPFLPTFSGRFSRINMSKNKS